MSVFRKVRRGLIALARILHRSHSGGRDVGAPTVLIDLIKPIPLRTLRELLILFSEGGYTIWLRGKFNLFLLQIGEALQWHESTYLAWRYPVLKSNLMLCTDSSEPLRQTGFRKVVHLHYDYSPRLSLSNIHFAMPLPMHTQLYVEYHEVEHLATYRSTVRRVRILFAGNCDEEGYDLPIIREVYGKLSRIEIMKAILLQRWGRWISEVELSDLLKQEDYQNEFLMLDPTMRIHQQNWLRTVSRSDFFLCPPGVIFAWSCNLVEAIAVGTIPITNYSEWLFPPLKHGINALTFSTVEELGDVINCARRMSHTEIAEMRRNVIEFYKSHLDRGAFARRLMEDPSDTVHLHLWNESEVSAREAFVGTNQPMGEMRNPDVQLTV